MIVSALAQPTVRGEEKSEAKPSKQSVEIKKLAQGLARATIKGNFETVIELTYPKVVAVLGGKQKAIEGVKRQMTILAQRGIKIASYEVGEPGKAHTAGKNTFVIVPTKMEMSLPGGKLIVKSYLLGISGEASKGGWRFVDGAGMRNEAARAKFLPKFPSTLKLPPQAQPQVIQNKN